MYRIRSRISWSLTKNKLNTETFWALNLNSRLMVETPRRNPDRGLDAGRFLFGNFRFPMVLHDGIMRQMSPEFMIYKDVL